LLPLKNEKKRIDIKMVVADAGSAHFIRHHFFYLAQPAKSKCNR